MLTTSGAGPHGNFGQANHAATEAGVIGLAPYARDRGRPLRVRVDALAPMASTGMTRGVVDERLATALPAGSVSPVVLALHFRKPTVAAVAGVTPGYGMDLANMCDVSIAAENAAFDSTQVKYAMNGFGHGLLPKANSRRAPRMFLTGDPIDAHEALRVGIADEVGPVGQLRGSALRLAGQIAEHGPELTAILKEVSLRASHMDHVAATAYELRVTHDLPGRGLSARRIDDGLGSLRAGRSRATQRLAANRLIDGG